MIPFGIYIYISPADHFEESGILMAKQKIKPRLLTEKDKFAERLKSARLGSGLTQQAVADQAKISRSAIVSYELGRVVPGALELTRLAKALRVSPNFLLSGSEDFLGAERPGNFLNVSDPRLRAALLGICLDVLDRDMADHLTALIVALVRAKFPHKTQYDAFLNSLEQVVPFLQEFLAMTQDMTGQTRPTPADEGKPNKKKKLKTAGPGKA